MTNREQAKLTMYAAVDTYLKIPANVVIYSGDVPTVDEKANFDTVFSNCGQAVGKSGTVNTGFSQEKLTAQEKVAARIAVFAGRAHRRFEKLGKLTLAEQLYISVTDYMAPADADAALRIGNAIKLMNDNIADLTGYVTAANISEVQALLDTFTGTVGSSEMVHQLEPVDTAAAKASFAPVDKSIKDLLNVTRIFIGTPDEDFYKGLVAVSEVPAVNIHHTTVHVLVRGRADNQPVAGATGALSNTPKTAKSDLNGVLVISEVRSGPAIILTVTAPGFKTVTIQLGIQRGKDNSFDVFMDNV